MSDAIGGFLSLELNNGQEYHRGDGYISLNTARNCLEFILRTHAFSHVYMPFFSCDALLEPLYKLGIDYEFYAIDRCLEPVFDFDSLRTDEVFLYINYFGIKDGYVNTEV